MSDKVIQRKVLDLGEVSKYGKRHRASLEIELRSCTNTRDFDLNENVNYPKEFSVCGTIDIFERRHWHNYSGGQNIEEISRLYSKNKLVQEIASLWRRWHLNCMKGGTRTQEEYLRQYAECNPGWKYEYSQACEILKRAGLYEEKGYKYGHAWLSEPLPIEVENRIREIMD